MKPPVINLITGAITAGAAADATQSMKDAYSDLEKLITRKFADKNDAKGEMALTEYGYDSVTWAKPLEKALVEAGADKDENIIHAAQKLMRLVKPNQDATRGTDESVNLAERLARIRQISRGGRADSDLPKYAGRSRFAPLALFCSIALPLILLMIILSDENFGAVTGSNWQLALSVLVPPIICVAIMLALSKVYKNIGIGMALFVLIPLCSTVTSLVSASLLLDKSVTQIVSGLVTQQEKSDANENMAVTPAKEDLKPLVPPETVPGKETESTESAGKEDLASPGMVIGKDAAEAPPGIVGDQDHTPGAVKAYDFVNSMGMKFVYIPAGSFMMGSHKDEPGRYSYETLHRVTLTRGFYMQTTEMTQGQWNAVMGNNPSNFKYCGDDCPVETVSWNDAQEFIKKLNALEERDLYRLPTEAEWEYACRAGRETPFAYGLCLTVEQANYNGKYPLEECPEQGYRKKIIPVASLAPNAWGLYDMHGNVWEWCHDWYDKYLSDNAKDPEGPASGSGRVIRGGSWFDRAMNCRSGTRFGNLPGNSDLDLGFRLARSASK